MSAPRVPDWLRLLDRDAKGAQFAALLRLRELCRLTSRGAARAFVRDVARVGLEHVHIEAVVSAAASVLIAVATPPPALAAADLLLLRTLVRP